MLDKGFPRKIWNLFVWPWQSIAKEFQTISGFMRRWYPFYLTYCDGAEKEGVLFNQISSISVMYNNLLATALNILFHSRLIWFFTSFDS